MTTLESGKSSPKRPAPPKAPARWPRGLVWLVITLSFLYLYRLGSVSVEGAPITVSYGEFFQWLSENGQTQKIRSAILTDGILRGDLDDRRKYLVNLPDADPYLIPLLREQVPSFRIEPPRTLLLNFIFNLLGPLILFGALWFLLYRSAAQGGGRLLSFGKSRAREVTAEGNQVTFQDVAGVNEAKEELQEVIEFLKDPRKFQRLGGKIPKGVLLLGPPGCGKTLMARAVAGEAGVPFYSISGSDFVEMFVGVGASRVRDLFDQAKKSAKTSGHGCIIFIDEIDAVGRQRFAGIGGGHDEREQTLNALLVEMDGFNTQEGVILVAATNRPDVLDPALMRPGRFDRQIVIDRPDLVGREEILKVHSRKVKLDTQVNLKSIARQTPGFSGADLANLVNEAALLASRLSKDAVTTKEMEAAIERVMAGPERKSRLISPYEKSIVACHEAGHALVSMMIPGSDPVHKVSIIPRGTAALGYTMQTPIEDRYIMTRKELTAKLTVLLGGRSAEELTFEDLTTGAQNDLEIATEIARKMVCVYGMSERLGALTLGRRESAIFLGRDLIEDRNYSEETAHQIDEEVRRIVEECHQRARELVTQHKDRLKALTDALLEKEVLDGDEAKRIVMAQPPQSETPASAEEPPQAVS
ncbi:MAG: ATP-dependent metallopeptidase FtsH/Yme1/Tma family protein [Candidatus Omnitrophica bacterium]|nr:ATP-dependent metallopeptidase FtsH/Yme1/Tma family protein [Candidatus Omnitrophota bacterium]